MFLQMVGFLFFLWLNNIPLCLCATSSLSILYHDGHLGCFHFLVIGNSEAINIGRICLFQSGLLHSYGKFLELEFLGQMVFLFWAFWGNSILLSTMVELIYTPTSSVEVFPILHNLTNICCLSFGWWPSLLVEVISHWGFNLYFSDD